MRKTAVYLTEHWFLRLLFFVFLLVVFYKLITAFLQNFNLPPSISAFTNLLPVLVPSIIIEGLRPHSKVFYIGFFTDKISVNNLLRIFYVSTGSFVFYVVLLIVFGAFPVVSFESVGILSVIVILFLNSFAEELLFRGVIFQALIEGIGEIAAALIISLIFAALHLFNPDASVISTFNSFLFSLLMSYAFIRTRSIIAVTLLHFLWNIFQVVILGWAVSGFLYTESLLYFPKENLPNWLSGGDYGIEATFVITLLILLQGYLLNKFLKISPFVSSLLLKRDFPKY